MGVSKRDRFLTGFLLFILHIRRIPFIMLWPFVVANNVVAKGKKT